jgi:hypothetical protein
LPITTVASKIGVRLTAEDSMMRVSSVTIAAVLAILGSGCSPSVLSPDLPTGPTPPPTCSSQPVTITFSGLTGPYASPVSGYQDMGFTVSLTEGTWLKGTAFQAEPPPAPQENYIYFNTPYGTTSSGEIRITANGCAFTFRSLALYSSVTPIPYQFTGLKGGAIVYTLTDMLPWTSGTFKTVSSSHFTDGIDALIVTVSNPATNVVCCGKNPVGIGHIALNY